MKPQNPYTGVNAQEFALLYAAFTEHSIDLPRAKQLVGPHASELLAEMGDFLADTLVGGKKLVWQTIQSPDTHTWAQVHKDWCEKRGLKYKDPDAPSELREALVEAYAVHLRAMKAMGGPEFEAALKLVK